MYHFETFVKDFKDFRRRGPFSTTRDGPPLNKYVNTPWTFFYNYLQSSWGLTKRQFISLDKCCCFLQVRCILNLALAFVQRNPYGTVRLYLNCASEIIF